MHRNILFLFLIIATGNIAYSQISKKELPMIGAEVFIEPGQTPEQIDTWFKRMKEAGMTVTRIRLFESYMHQPDGTWDYTLYDEAYKAGEKYGIKIYGNPFPATPFTDVGGLKYPRDEEHLRAIADCLKNMVTHFRKFASCYGWVPINEHGIDRIPPDPFSRNKFNEWKKRQPVSLYKSKGYEHFDFAEERFLLDYNAWFLQWLTDEIRKYDPGKAMHVNGRGIFVHVPLYKYPEWRKHLTSLGGSAHPSWHYGYFLRNQYAVAMSANSEILRSGAGDIPWFMTEVQGGINTYSGNTPMDPTPQEISQWLWTILAAEGKGAMLWCLNPRASGIEAGEWALLNFRDEPSGRMQAAASIISVINKNSTLFADLEEEESGINILYIHEAMWVEKKLQSGGAVYEGRNVGGVLKSALGYFEAFSEMGLQANLKEIDEFDFSKSDYTGSTIILAHQVAIPSRYWQKIEAFVSKGGKLIADGLTGYYDENAVCIMKTGFPFENIFGGNIKEFKMVDNLFDVKLTDPNRILPAHLWRGTISLTSGRPVGTFGNEVIASRNNYGKGETVWVPSLLGLGARISKDYSKLSAFLSNETVENMHTAVFRFKKHQPGMLMKTARSGEAYITVIINKSKENRAVELVVKNDLLPEILFSNMNGTVSNNTVVISPEETIVIHWKKKM